jgi:hypothetical protein
LGGSAAAPLQGSSTSSRTAPLPGRERRRTAQPPPLRSSSSSPTLGARRLGITGLSELGLRQGGGWRGRLGSLDPASVESSRAARLGTVGGAGAMAAPPP